jgi:predicted ATP-dependent serine protease
MSKNRCTLWVSIDSPSALSLYCEECGETIASWDGKAPTLQQLDEAAEKHCAKKHADSRSETDDAEQHAS